MKKQHHVEPLETRRLFSTYYVSSTGNDNAAGTSTDQAWQTVERVNTYRLRAGDAILFEGGETFTGGLYVSTKETGTPAKQIIFSSYGDGRATINSGALTGLEVSEVGGIAVTNLNFVGGASNDTSGIYIHAGMAGRSLSSFHVRNVDVSNYGHEGVTMIASGGGSTISDVKIERSSFHDNGWGGVNITGNTAARGSDYLIDHVRAFNNDGVNTNGFVTGNGIYLADVTDAILQRCVVFGNGSSGVAPVGIWTSDSARVTFQYNESYDNRTASSTDGGGFDFDWDVADSVMQYNCSHGNSGPGYMLGAGSHVNSGNIIRYNISQNDGRQNGKGAIYLWGNVTNANVYNNVVYMSPTGNAASAAVQASEVGASGKIPQLVWLRNNIFQTAGGTKLINLTDAIASGSALAFNGNAYYAGGATFAIKWGSTTFSSVSDWRDAIGEERYKGVATGYDLDPRLVDPAAPVTLGNADDLDQLSNFRLRRNSHLIDKGLPQFGGSVAVDFFGDPVPLGRRCDIGIDELG